MKSKLLLAAPLMAFALLMMTFASALDTNQVSFRASGGVLNFVGSDNAFTFTKIDFSAWHQPGRLAPSVITSQGQGTLQVTATTTSGERVTLNLNLKESQVLESSASRLYVANTATGVYWKKGITPKTTAYVVRYDYNLLTGTVNIAGEGLVNFRITNAVVKTL